MRLVRDLRGLYGVSGGHVLGKLKLPVVFPLKDCFCFYLDVFTGGGACDASSFDLDREKHGHVSPV